MTKETVVSELHRSCEEIGLLPTLYAAFGPSLRFSMPYSLAACNTPLDTLDFSVRAMNALKRAGLSTIGNIIDCIQREELAHIRNLGRKTVNEIGTRLLVFGFEHLNEKDRKAFLADLIDLNCS